MIEVGVIHGRFQILHNDHLEYLLAGKKRCSHMVVGITNPDPVLTKKEPSDAMRSDPEANPLTYYERQILVREALKEAGAEPDSFSVVPFPISHPELYRCYVPMDAVFFLTIYDDWGEKKLRRFTELGLETEILWRKPEAEKGILATDVRLRMRRGEPWEHLVPPSVADCLKKWEIPSRLKSFGADG